MKEPGLRAWIIAHPKIAGVIFLACMLVIVWGNVRLPRGGMFDGEVILREDDPYRQQDRYVTVDKRHEGFVGQEAILFFLNTGVRTAADLQRVREFAAAAERRFGETILSLANLPRYKDDGEGLQDNYYITAEELARPEFSVREWKERVEDDPSVFGVFVARNFAWSAVVRYLPPDHDEVNEYRKTVEFLEDRSIPAWEWLWRTDINPSDQGIGVGGWVMGRGELDQGLNVDMVTLVCVGVGLTLVVFWLIFGSAWDALVCVGVMVACGFIWTRGLMGLLGMTERVFSVLVYASAVVTGTSFALHKIEAYRDSGATAPARGWRAAMSVDSLIVITGIFSAYGFLTLWYNFDVTPIRELGIASAVGVGCLVVLAQIFLPPLHRLGRQSWIDPPPRRQEMQNSMVRRCRTFLDRAVESCTRFAEWLAEGKRPWIVVGLVCGLFLLAVALFVSDHIESRTRALDYVRGTAIEKQARYLNQPGNPGFEFLDLLVEPAGKGDLYDPHFIARTWEYQQGLYSIPGAREVLSVVSSVRRIAQESYKKPLPTSRAEVDEAFRLIEGRLSVLVQKQLYFPHGVRVGVSYGFDDSVRLGRFCDAVLDLAHTQFPDLKVSAFGKVPIYPQVDRYVREGKVENVFTSQGGLFVLCAILLAWRGWGRTDVHWLSPLRGGLAMSAPLFVATAMIGLLMAALDIPLDIATASIGALAINAAQDFSLYLALAYQNALQTRTPYDALRVALQREGKIILADCLLNTCCFLPLVLSRFSPIAAIGWLMAVMLAACAIGTLFVMAPLLPRCVSVKEVSV